mgnify:CR=1 FL=1
MHKYITNQLIESIDVKRQILENHDVLENIIDSAKACIAAYATNNKILIAGNGGSAADAQHIAGELVSKFYFDRPGLAATALTTDTSIITAIGNDYGYENLFSRQLEANGTKGDIFIGISTSGTSENILKALKECKKKDIFTIGLTGEKLSQMNHLCDICINIPSNSTPRIQEAHIVIGHILCAIIEEKMFGTDF